MKLNIVYSTSHLLMPKIIGCILVILLIGIVLTEAWRKRGNSGEVVSKRFFEERFDKKKLFGGFGLFLVYIAVMEMIGFLAARVCLKTKNCIISKFLLQSKKKLGDYYYGTKALRNVR